MTNWHASQIMQNHANNTLNRRARPPEPHVVMSLPKETVRRTSRTFVFYEIVGWAVLPDGWRSPSSPTVCGHVADCWSHYGQSCAEMECKNIKKAYRRNCIAHTNDQWNTLLCTRLACQECVSQCALVFMPPPFCGSNEAFPTAATPVSIVVCVLANHVLSHGRMLLETGRTEGAAVLSLFRVGPVVDGELLSWIEPGRAHVTPVILHTIVGLYMSDVVRHVLKPGTTLLTLADHLPCVDAFVWRQVTTQCECPPADVTHVRPESTVCPMVCRQITPPRKRLATVVTAEWPLPCVLSLVTCHTRLMVRGVLAPVTLVSAVPADVAVTLLHVLLQTTLSQTCIVAVGAVKHAFTWEHEDAVWCHIR